MKRIHKILCCVVIVTILVSVVCISSSADSYVFDDTVGNFFTTTGRDFMGLPFHLSVDMGRGYYLNADNYGSTLYDFYQLNVSPSVDHSGIISTNPNEVFGVRSLLTTNITDSSSTAFAGTSSNIVSSSVYNQQIYNGLFRASEEVILDELFDIEKINSPSTLSGGGVPVFSYDGILDTYYLKGDDYFGRFPSYLTYDLLINEDYLSIDNNQIDYSGALGKQAFRFYLSCDILSVEDNKLISSPYVRTWTADPSMSTDYVRFEFSTGISRYLGLNYYNQGANVNSIRCRFNLRRFYHLIGNNFPNRYIKNLHFYVEPLDTLNDGSSSSSPLWNDSFIDSFSSIGIPTPCLGFSLEYSPIDTGLNYDDYDDGFYRWLIDSGVDNVTEYVSLEDFNLVEWLGNTVGSVFNVNILGPITLGSILYLVLGIGFLYVVVKFFAGG